MKLVHFIFVGACSCVFTSTIAESPNVEFKPHPHIMGARISNEAIAPVIMHFSLYKDNEVIRQCSGAHIQKDQISKAYWIVPAECVDAQKYDKILVRYRGPTVLDRTAFFYNISSIKYHIHPLYNNVIKADNIAVVVIPHMAFLDLRHDYKSIELPNVNESFAIGRTLELFESSSATNQLDSNGNALLLSVKTKRIQPIWCRIFYPFSFIKVNHICTSGLFNKGLLENDLGTPLVARDGESFKLVGLATIVTPWAHRFSLPMEFLSIKPYLAWINSIIQGKSGF